MSPIDRVHSLRSSLRLPESRGFWISVAAGLLGVGIVLSAVFWGWLRGDESASMTIRNIGIAIAGSVALPLVIWRGLVADRQAAATQSQAATAQEGLLDERYDRAARMAQSGAASEREAGIYDLQRLAREHRGLYQVRATSLLQDIMRRVTREEEADDEETEEAHT